jgi:hypothetical protein
MNTDYPIAYELFDELWSSLGGNKVWLDRVRFHGHGALPSAFAVTDFAGGGFGVVSCSFSTDLRVSQLLAQQTNPIVGSPI